MNQASVMQRSASIFLLFLMVASHRCAMSQSNYSVTPPTYRTKANQTVAATEYPPVDSEERYWAVLVSSDPINRKGVLRWEQRDRMIEFQLLPYAPLFYRGAPAALGDIPPGTTVEVWGYGDEVSSLPRHILRMSDSFSVQAFSQIAFRVDSIDSAKKTFQGTPVKVDGNHPYIPSQSIGGSPTANFGDQITQFSYDDQTDWYLGDRIVDDSALSVGQQVRVNFRRKFFEGPPLITRCTEVWLDRESQTLATNKQTKAFLSYQRDRGFPLRVDSVDDAKKQIRVSLLETGLIDIAKEWKPDTVHDLSAATTSLRMWEPNGGQGGPDRMFGVTIREIKEVPTGYGRGGVEMTIQVPRLYEAYRAGTIIKLYPNNHPIPILPIEERMPKEFDTFLRP